MAHRYSTAREKRIDFWIGFAGWVVVNGILVAIDTQLGVTGSQIGGGLLIIGNVLAIAALAITRPYMAMGVVLAFAAAFALTVIEGIFFTISDFAGGLNNTSIQTGFLIFGGLVFLVLAVLVLRAIHRGIT